SRRRHTRWPRDWSSDVCSSDLGKDFGVTRERIRNVLQLANSLARHPEILAHVFQRLRLSTVETETLSDDFFLAFVEHFEKPVHLDRKSVVAQQFERCFRVLVADYFTELGRAIVPNCCVE